MNKKPTHKDKSGNLYYKYCSKWVKVVGSISVCFKEFDDIKKIKLI